MVLPCALGSTVRRLPAVRAGYQPRWDSYMRLTAPHTSRVAWALIEGNHEEEVRAAVLRMIDRGGGLHVRRECCACGQGYASEEGPALWPDRFVRASVWWTSCWGRLPTAFDAMFMLRSV